MPSATTDTIDYITLNNIIVNLVTEPNDVVIDRSIDEKGVLLSIQVNAKDMGIVIGRNGIMANSIKTIMRALGKAHGMNVRIEFLEPDGSRNTNNTNHIDLDESGPTSEGLEEFAIN